LEFIDTSDFSIMNAIMPEMTTDIEWDPTGRYVMSAVSAWTGKVSDTGFSLLNFQGKTIRKERVERFGNLFWRPRPPCLLTHVQVKNIKKNLKTYSPAFEEKDRKRRTKAEQGLVKKRQDLLDVWNEYRAKKEEQYKSQKPKRMFLRNNNDTDELGADKNQLQEEIFEILIKEDVQPMDGE